MTDGESKSLSSPVFHGTMSVIGSTATHQQGRWTCGSCGKELSTRGSLRKHEFRHTGRRQYPCMKCQAWFRRKAERDHHQLSHDRTQKHMCRMCGYRCDRWWNFKYHMASMHGLLVDGSLPPNQQHEILHIVTPFMCSDCKHRFRLRVDRDDHQLRHCRPNVCRVCSAMYSCRSNLRRHVLNTHGLLRQSTSTGLGLGRVF
jgi:KRAB domain-containing zinc finger protein